MMSNRRITRLDGASQTKFFTGANVSLGETWFVYLEVAFDSAHVGDQSLFSIWDGGAGDSALWLRRRDVGGTLDLLDRGVSSFSPIIRVAHSLGGVDRLLLTGNGTDVKLYINDVENTGVGSDRSGSGWAYVTDGSAVPVRFGTNRGIGEQLNGAILKAAIGSGTVNPASPLHRWNFNDNGGAGSVPDLIGSNDLTKNGMDSSEVSVYDRVVSPAGWTNGVETFNYNFSLKYAGIVDIGQSNMLSRATAQAQDLIYTDAMGAQQLAYSTQVVANAVQPLDHVDETPGDMSSWLVFVNNLVQTNYVPVDYEVMMIPVAEGGTSVAYWAGSGSTGYDQMITSVTAFEALNADNYILAFRWIQGEADASAGTSQSLYVTRFNALRDGTIADISSVTSSTPWLLTEITGPVGAGADTINAALNEIADSSVFIRITSNSTLTLEDALHYDVESQRAIGALNYADYDAIYSLIPVSFTISGTPDGTYRTMVVTFNAGLDPVVIYNDDASFSSGVASIELPASSGDEVTAMVFNSSRVLNGFKREVIV